MHTSARTSTILSYATGDTHERTRTHVHTHHITYLSDERVHKLQFIELWRSDVDGGISNDVMNRAVNHVQQLAKPYLNVVFGTNKLLKLREAEEWEKSSNGSMDLFRDCPKVKQTSI